MNFIRSTKDVTKDRQLSRSAARRVEKAIERNYPGAEVLHHVPDYCTTWIKVNALIQEVEWCKLEN